MDIVETITLEEFKVNIYYDSDPESPREWDNLGKMVCWHRRYNLGDEKPNSFDGNTPSAFLFGLADQVDPNVDKVDYEMTEEIRDNLLEKYYIMLPLYLYDHSGITMRTHSFNDRWDSGQVGYIYVSIADAKKEWGWKRLTKARREKLEEHLRLEVKTYDQFLTGSVYGYQIVDEDDEVLDSCWGFFGYDHEKSGLMENVRGYVKYQKEKVTNETHDSLTCAAI